MILSPILRPIISSPLHGIFGHALFPTGAILHFDASTGFVDQTGNQTVTLIGSAYPTVTAGYAVNASGAEWGFSTTTGPVKAALESGEVTLVQVVTLPLMSSLTDATDYSLFGDLLFVRRDGTSGSFKCSDGTNTAVVAYDWDDGEVVRVVARVADGKMAVGILASSAPSIVGIVNTHLGALYDPSHIETLFQDAAMTTPVTTVGQTVRAMRDCSGNGYHAVNASGTAPTYTVDADGVGRLTFDAFAYLEIDGSVVSTSAPLTMCADVVLTAAGVFPGVFNGSTLDSGAYLGLGSNTTPRVRFSVAGGTAGIKTADGHLLTVGNGVVLFGEYDGVNVSASSLGGGAVNTAAVGTVGEATKYRIGYNASPVQSPFIFYGGLVAQKILTIEEKGRVLNFYAGKRQLKTQCFAIGDSTTAAYAGGTAILGLLTSAYTKNTLAAAGQTIAQQAVVWAMADIHKKHAAAWAVIQVGLNDLDPAESAATALARLQSFVTRVRAEVAAGGLVFISCMNPCRARLISFYGATNGPVAYQKWQDMNAAIMGNGASAIAGVSGRIDAHVALLSDGSGNLAAAYDTGDGIHPNTAGRQIVADAWQAAIIAAGGTV